MKTVALAVLITIAALPLTAGEIHGKVVCKGARNSADAVVYVDRIAGKTFDPPATHVKFDQKSMKFVPHVLPVVIGTTVDFLNSDAVLHNVFSPDACAEKFNLGTWPQGQVKSYTFKKECVAVLLCNVHPEMEAFVLAVPTPYFAVAAADGSYAIPNIPDGTYILKVWHPKLKPFTQKVTVSGDTIFDAALAK